MNFPPSGRADPVAAPAALRDAMAELVQIGMSVARMVGRAAEAETALAAVTAVRVPFEAHPVAATLDEAIEADRILADAGEVVRTALQRTEAVAGAFARVSRAVRRTVLLCERLERGWGVRPAADDRQAMARRQVARGVADAIRRGVDGSRVERLTEAAAERLDALDGLEEIGERPAEEIIAEICRDLGVDPVRMPPGEVVPGLVPGGEDGLPEPGVRGPAPRRRPDG